MKAVIMAGGKGTRFWPRSTTAKPKQFLSLTSSEATMLQETYSRFRSCLSEDDVYVAVSRNYLPLVREQLPQLSEKQLIIEPEQRDTAPCIALTASFFQKRGLNEVIVTAPSDQYIPDAAELMEALRAAEQAAQDEGVVVTMGIVPTRAETGYGYIEAGEHEDGKYGPGIKTVKAFIEKPTLSRAEELIAIPNMYWNSGIFIWKPSTIAGYMQLYQPDMWRVFELEGEQLAKAYVQLPKLSIDYALIEKLECLYTLPIAFTWDDVGVWTSLERIFGTDGDGNILLGKIYPTSTSNSIVYAEQQRVLVIGVDNLIVVSTDEGLLICHKTQEQAVKQAIAAMDADREGGMP